MTALMCLTNSVLSSFALFTENHVESTAPSSSSDSVAGAEETQQSLTVNGATSEKTTSQKSTNGHRGIYSQVKGDPPLDEGLSVNRDKLSIETAEDDLVYETHDIRGKFHVLFTIVRNFLMSKGVTVKNFVSFLKEVPGYGRKSLLDKGMISKLYEAPDLIDVFDTVRDYCSWFNHSLLGLIIEVYCEDNREIKKKHEKYHAHIQEYCKHRIKKCPLKNGFGHGGKKDKALIMKVDSEWEEIRIEQLEEVVINVARILKVSRHTLHLCSVEKGCVQVTVMVPNHIPAAVFPLSTEQETAMMKMRVIDLQCESYHFACQVHVHTMYSLGSKMLLIFILVLANHAASSSNNWGEPQQAPH